jgi:hypothetical protein
MPAPLDINLVINEFRTQYSNMTFIVPVMDESGNQTGTTEMKASGAGIEEMAKASGTAVFNILKTQVQVQTVDAVVVGGVAGTGTGIGGVV